ncbi:MAG: diguanylate cyclase [Cellvibrio sp.]|nr:diguanylate cyclase [Cellvibrio sp.]
MKICYSIILFVCFSYVYSLNTASDGNGRYAMQMLKLALSKIDTPYELITDENLISQSRNIELVSSGQSDLLWAATNQQMEDTLLPIRIPLYKGLLGHRIFIIRKGDQPRFDQVSTIEDLRRLTFGQGKTWADTEILRSNKFTVITANKYKGLFYMLDGSRFDAFPRGVQEPWQELEDNSSLPLTVEQKIMLVYRMPFYFFTTKNNGKLAKDIESGLNKSLEDGSFDRIFLNDPMIKSVIEKANLKERKVFKMDNPALPKETPLERSELWLDIGSLQ